MSSVTVGIFDTQEAANDAKNKLLLDGFANETVVVSDEEMDTMRTDSIIGSTSVQPEQKEGAISRFFSSIFGSRDYPDQYGDTYREAIRRGHYGVSVSVHGEDEIGRAEAILTGCGAVNIDERAEQWRGEGWMAGGALADAPTPAMDMADDITRDDVEKADPQTAPDGVPPLPRDPPQPL